MARKSSQATVFIILGIVIVMLVVVLMLAQPKFEKQSLKSAAAPENEQAVKTFVEQCLRQEASFGLFLVGIQGGFTEPSAMSFNTNFSSIPYQYYKGAGIAIPLELVEKRLSKFVESNLPICLDGFKALKDFEIQQGKIIVEALSTDSEVVFSLKYPLSVRNGESFTEFNDFSVILPVRLKRIHNVMQTIVDKALIDPKHIDMTYLEHTGMNISIYPVNNDTLVYAIVDEMSVLNNAPYVYIFANIYAAKDLNDKSELSPPVLDYIPDISITLDEPFVYQVKADDWNNDPLTYSAYSDLNVEISSEGKLTIQANEKDVGDHYLFVKVEDSTGLADSVTVQVRVSA